jgi:beta-phosphoglucomutase family hydrolase
MSDIWTYDPQKSGTSTTRNNIIAVIWDMDGVLVDTGGFHYQIWKEVLAGYAVDLTPERFRSAFGMNNDGLLRLLLGNQFDPELAASISKQKEAQLRRSIRGQIQAFPGVRPLLEALRMQGIPQALASSAPLANIKAVLAELALENSFQAVVSAEHMSGKPDPAVFLEAARLLGVESERCVVIEDALPGVQAAKSAGMLCLAVATTNPPEALTAADRVVKSLEEIGIEDLFAL